MVEELPDLFRAAFSYSAGERAGHLVPRAGGE